MNTFMHFERATMQWLLKGYQRRALRQAVDQAYGEFAQIYPESVASLFDEYFVRKQVLPLLIQAANEGTKVTAMQVTELWARQISILPRLRQQHSARMLIPATHFLCMVSDALAETLLGRDATLFSGNALVETAAG